MFQRYIKIILLLLVISPLYSEEDGGYSYKNHLYASQPAGWVDRISPALTREGEPIQENGIYWLLLDEQDNVETGHSYYHMVVKIQNEDGIENFPQLKVYFSPFFQNVMFHQLNIYRNGDPTPIKLLNTAYMEAEKAPWATGMNVYSSNVEVTIPELSLEVGDIVEFSYTLAGTNSLLQGRYNRTFYFEYDYDIDQVFFKAAGIEYRFNQIEYPLSRVLPNAQRSDLSWHIGNGETKNIVGNIAPSVDPYSRVHISDFESWEDVSLWAYSLFEINSATLDWLKYTALEHTDSDTEIEQILDLVRFVQDDIELIEREAFYAFKPRAATYTLQNGYGDSREKALLLKTLLLSIGINSDILLVNTKNASFPIPSPDSFDRACVAIYSGDNTYYIDPSLSKQGGSLAESYWPYTGDVLRVGYIQDALIEPPLSSPGKVHIQETLDISDVESQLYQLEVTHTFYNSEADRIRRMYTMSDQDSFQNYFYEQYKERFNQITRPDDVEIDDDRDTNIFRVLNKYVVSDIWSVSGKESIWKASIYNYKLSVPTLQDEIIENETSNEYGWYLGDQIDKEHLFEIKLPSGCEIPENQNFSISNSSFESYQRLLSENNKLTISNELKINESIYLFEGNSKESNNLNIPELELDLIYRVPNYTPFIILFSTLVLFSFAVILIIRFLIKKIRN